jgi:hypothetical protein
VQKEERPNSQRYQRIQHGAPVEKVVEYFKRMTLVSKDQMVACKALKALFEISYKIAETGENDEMFTEPVIFQIVSTMLSQNYEETYRMTLVAICLKSCIPVLFFLCS